MKFIVHAFVFFMLSSAVYAQPAGNLAEADNQFAVDLYTHLSSSNANVFFSPYSLSSALSMTFEGARNATAEEMQKVLYLPSDREARRLEVSDLIQRMNRTDKSYQLNTANALWSQKAYPFKEDYFKLIKDTYYGEAHNLDFAANPEDSRGTINNWVFDTTKKKIKDLLPAGSIDGSTRLVLTNAVYFKAKWQIPFEKSVTKKDVFWVSPEKSIEISMMGLVGKMFPYMEDDQVQILELPYQGFELSMLIILPKAKDLSQLEKSLDESNLKGWQEAMKAETVNVFIPKFKFEAKYEMKNILRAMGMKDAFDGSKADFSGMTGQKDLYIDEVYHKAWIDVNEEGTEAAAATAVSMRFAGMVHESKPKNFRADHPFIVVIQDSKTRHILFMGRVSNPKE